MDLDYRQTRRLYLAGTVAFPIPYPSSGIISFESGNLKYAANEPAKVKVWVVVQEYSHRDRTIIRAILQEDVAAIFIPGTWKSKGEFRISRKTVVDDLEAGEWFVDSDVNSAAISARLELSKGNEITSRDSKLRGIVFVAKDARVLSIAEMTETAAAMHTEESALSIGPVRSEMDHVIDFDSTIPAKGRATAHVACTADTFVPHDDLFKARDTLNERFGGHESRIAAVSMSSPNEAGRENVLGFGVGFRYTAKRPTGDVAVKVYVREKLPLRRINASFAVPGDIDGVPTDVEEIGEVMLHSYTKRYPRPVPSGVAVSNIKFHRSGTLGCLVVLNNGKLCILSNNHVLANENSAEIGDDIIQPGYAESAPAEDQVIGVLENFAKINATRNSVDAAVAWTSDQLASPVHITYYLNPTPIPVALGMTVLKNGSSTEATIGIVTDLGANISVQYEPFPAGAEMINQVAIRGISGSFSMPGDSGSLIVTNATKQPVALLFAGSSDSSITFANPIHAVIAALGIKEFVGVQLS